MTLPDERYRSVIQTRKFLEELLTTPRVPKAIRESARWCLRHYPSDWEMSQVADASPHIFAEKMEPVYRMFKKYEEGKNNEDKTSQ